MKRAVLLIAAVAGALAGPANGETSKRRPGFHDTIRVTPLSQQYGPSHAAIGARIDVRSRRPGRSSTAATRTERPARIAAHGGGISTPGSVRARPNPKPNPNPNPNPYPSLRSDSPVLRNAVPFGPGSFWYSDGSGHACMYAPDSVLPCYTVVAPPAEGTPGAPGLSPVAIAASVADRMPLSPGEIRTSPSARGLTGAASWFWLDPPPRTTTLSVTLAGERVTVTAEPYAVEWRFGDGAAFSGGAGVPYRPGPPPPEAVTHVYGTRCLPGDQGRNPYVLASCGEDGYAIEATVSWRISFQASGAVGAEGSLPTRTTEASAVYPVSEARAFLLGGGSQ
jgi:hypothetical protein